MRVFLAAQVLSNLMVELIDCYTDQLESKSEGYASLRALATRVDCLVDIVNATHMHNGKCKGCKDIDIPDHEHITEMLEIVEWFTEWYEQSEETRSEVTRKVAKATGWKPKKGTNIWYVPKSTYEDLCWLVLGLSGIAVTYLKTDGSRVLDQSRSGSDTCKHTFASIPNANCNPTLLDARKPVAKASVVKANTFHGTSRANTSGTKRMNVVELNSPLLKKIKN